MIGLYYAVAHRAICKDGRTEGLIRVLLPSFYPSH